MSIFSQDKMLKKLASRSDGGYVAQSLRRLESFFACCLLLTASSALAQYSTDERFLAGLRSQRLFDLAEDVCREKLSASKLTPNERIVLTIERMLILTDKGVNAPLAERPAVFTAARQVAEEFAKNFPDDPRGVLVRFQDALTVLTEGELQRLEADLGTSSPAAIDAAKTKLREAVNLLEKFDSDLQKQIPESRKTAAGESAISAAELKTLRAHVGYQLARAARNQAMLYPEKSEDRTASLLRGKRQLEDAALSLEVDDPQSWRAGIEQITFERMLGDLQRASRLIEELAAKDPPLQIIPALRAEQVRLLIASGKAANAATEGVKWAEEVSRRDAELDLAVLEALVADPAAKKSADDMLAMLAQIEQRHGPYWGRRASALALKSLPSSMATENLELLGKSADQLFLQNNFDEAIAAYDRAAQKAREAKKETAFVELAIKAALAEQQRGGYSEAVRRLVELSARPEAADKAAEIHLQAAFNQKQLVAAAPTDARLFVTYEQLLKDQIAKFPNSPTASQAKLWLAREYEKRREYAGAYKYADMIPAGAKEKEEALLICLRDWNRRSSNFGDRKTISLQTALDWSHQAEGDLSTPVQRQIRAASVGWELLHHRQADHAKAEARLHELLQKTPPNETDIIASAKTLLVVALAAQPQKHEEAAKLLAESGGTAKQRLTALLGLVKVTKSASGETQIALGKFVLEAIEKLKAQLGELSAAEQIQVDLAYAEGLVASGDRTKGDAAFSALAKKYANSASIQEAYAVYLSDIPAPLTLGHLPGGETGSVILSHLQRALDQWRLVASRTQPRTERWYRAKYYVAKLQLQMGQATEAAKLIDSLDAAPPGLKGAPMEAEFRELRKQCEK